MCNLKNFWNRNHYYYYREITTGWNIITDGLSVLCDTLTGDFMTKLYCSTVSRIEL